MGHGTVPSNCGSGCTDAAGGFLSPVDMYLCMCKVYGDMNSQVSSLVMGEYGGRLACSHSCCNCLQHFLCNIAHGHSKFRTNTHSPCTPYVESPTAHVQHMSNKDDTMIPAMSQSHCLLPQQHLAVRKCFRNSPILCGIVVADWSIEFCLDLHRVQAEDVQSLEARKVGKMMQTFVTHRDKIA